MRKSLFIPVVAALALAGCAQTGPNQAVGTGVGAVGGYAVGRALGGGAAGSAVGAVAGALVGSSVGQSMDRPAPPPVVVQQPPVVVYERPVTCRIERQWDSYYRTWVDRRVCYR
jgi:osmotically inducible lipoprotein OsmB